MKHVKLIFIIIVTLFIIIASALIYASIKQEPRAHQLPLSDLVCTEPVKFENLKMSMC